MVCTQTAMAAHAGCRNITVDPLPDLPVRNEIQHMVKEHNGACRIINAFKFGEPESFYKHELKHVDIAVLVQNINKHSTSKLVRKYAKRFAIADSAGLSAIERAIYRAMYGLPAYETSTQPIAYPVKDAANA